MFEGDIIIIKILLRDGVGKKRGNIKFKYYTCSCPNWKWSYKYHYPPLLKDLYKHIPNKFHDFIITDEKSYCPLLQLSYVLPIQNHNILPDSVKSYLHDNESQYFKEHIEFEWAFCKYFWESHALLPKIPVNTLEKWDKMWC